MTTNPDTLARSARAHRRGRARKPLAVFEFGDEWEFADFETVLQGRMKGATYWRIDGEDIGWMRRSGHRFVRATTARALLQAFYSEDILRLYCGPRPASFVIKAPTHDTPTGSRYTFTPIAASTYERHA